MDLICNTKDRDAENKHFVPLVLLYICVIYLYFPDIVILKYASMNQSVYSECLWYNSYVLPKNVLSELFNIFRWRNLYSYIVQYAIHYSFVKGSSVRCPFNTESSFHSTINDTHCLFTYFIIKIIYHTHNSNYKKVYFCVPLRESICGDHCALFVVFINELLYIYCICIHY